MSAPRPSAGDPRPPAPATRHSSSGLPRSGGGLALCLALASFLVLLLAQTSVHRLCACGHTHPRCNLLCTAHEQLQFGACTWVRADELLPLGVQNSTSGVAVSGQRPSNASAPQSQLCPGRRQRVYRTRHYDSLRVYILVADWSPDRKANADEICAHVRVDWPCTLVPAPRGHEYDNSSIAALEAQGLVTLAPTQPEPAPLPGWVPQVVRPALRDWLPNQLNASFNWRWNKALGNTVGVIWALQQMKEDIDAAEAIQPGASAKTLYVFLEDDALIRSYPTFSRDVMCTASRLRPGSWDLLLLTVSPGLCERSAKLPPPLRVPHDGLFTPRFSFSRTTGMVHSAEGVARILDNLPADNIIDMWLRRLMRAGAVRVRMHCGDIVTFGATAAKQARRLYRRALISAA